MTEALVNQDLIRWALDRQHLTRDAIAKKVNVKPASLAKWEEGAARPTLRQAKQLALSLKIPFGFLFLSAPPVEEVPLPDLRTVAVGEQRVPSPDLRDVLHDALLKQRWYRAYLEEQGAKPLPFVGRFSVNGHHGEVAGDVKDTLAINVNMRQGISTWEEFLRQLIRRAERSGVLVLRSGVVGNNTHRTLDVDEFRGFAISDSFAPLLFLNSRDSRAAQIFTLAHELAHLWVNESGISNPDYRVRSIEQGNRVERFCNRVAAEILVPSQEFWAAWNEQHSTEANVQALAFRFKVSRFVVLRQSYELELITPSDYWSFFERFVWEQKTVKGTPGGDYYNNVIARSSHLLAMALLGGVTEGRVLHRDAAHLLDVQVKSLGSLAERVFGGQAA